MSTHKHIDQICAVVLALTLVITILFMNGASLGIEGASKVIGYENRLFDTSRVHTIDIVMDDWDSFIETCENEEYAVCAVIIDGESYKNVGIRAKGNTSLSMVSSMNSDRYSFKIEFDQYDSTKSYHGLDKLCLNNLIQDTTYMKDYLTYQLMKSFGVDTPLCSYIDVTINGKDWGLYLAVEGVEESFLQRNYGNDYYACIEEAKQELNSQARPALKKYLDIIDGYDNIFVCGPCWWGTFPMAIFTQLEKLDFTEKKVMAVMTHEGSGLQVTTVCLAYIHSPYMT